MRIIGGAAKGRRIRAPKGLSTRPTSDRVREAVFNILGPPPDGSRVLDLFAGGGGLGLEALSRGAARCVFVDRAGPAVGAARANAAQLGLAHCARVVRAEARAALDGLGPEAPFHWVFLDPPYASQDAARILVALGTSHRALLAEDAVVIVEHDKRNVPEDRYGDLVRNDRRRYGETEVSFYVVSPVEDPA